MRLGTAMRVPYGHYSYRSDITCKKNFVHFRSLHGHWLLRDRSRILTLVAHSMDVSSHVFQS